MTATCTHAEFERLSWHDCVIWGLELHPPDPEAGDWRCDLVLDIDFIVEWLCGVGREDPTRFRVAPATLRFDAVSDLRIAIDWGSSGAMLHEASIDRIEREPSPTAPRDRPRYRWRIALNWPRSGEIVLEAAGFTQTLRAEPIVTERQSLARRERRPMSPESPPTAPA